MLERIKKHPVVAAFVAVFATAAALVYFLNALPDLFDKTFPWFRDHLTVVGVTVQQGFAIVVMAAAFVLFFIVLVQVRSNAQQIEPLRHAVDTTTTWLYRRQNWGPGLSHEGKFSDPAPWDIWTRQKYDDLGLRISYDPPKQVLPEPRWTPPEENANRPVAHSSVGRAPVPSNWISALSEALTIGPIDQFITDPLTGNRQGNMLGIKCTGQATEVVDCRIRVESLSIRSDDGTQWYSRDWFTPTDLHWDGGSITHTFQLGAVRIAELVTVQTGPIMPQATVPLGEAHHVLDFQGTYRAVICVEARGYAVHRLTAEFMWGGAAAWVSLTPFSQSTPRRPNAPNQ
jgi:hypothetical protein